MSVRETIKNQIKGALEGANFPISTPEELLSAFPNGADTTCQAGDVKIKAGDAGQLLNESHFPFNSAEEVAETIVSLAKL